MANPLLLDIVTFLASNGAVQGDGIDAYRDYRPEEPDNLVVITEYSGSPAVAFEPAAHRSVQICARNKSADAARRKALEIYKLLQSENNIVVFTPDRWGQVFLRQPPYKMDVDNLGRTCYGFNIGITTTIE